ncbi:MAG: protein-(glutamine-N5) methyltransferase, release factor-specific [Candidatus Woykebacteria bacterium GWB1_45_5]|uniref:peptide chain release factor N(5)-glutamine methyltransferase n=1 Tax=Candidatus Woykebacteria bacterium GWB1_45_5 TaxID=1802592 RepID=A0A1G1W9M9_9BACT|nr:MAG: protein-(glutamine-N5) methyltransferase, release factor-specific [Candidatus Woykebacteria bacterium GWB1_45_5]
MLLSQVLNSTKIDSTEVEIFLAHLLGKDRSFVKAFPENSLNTDQTRLLKNFLKRRLKNEPLNYILGFKDFCGLRFKVDRRAMIPRPETEELVAEVIKHVYALPNRSLPNYFTKPSLTIVDVGTGCGNIAISLAKAIPFAKIYAIEKELRAWRLAKENISHHNVEDQVVLLRGDLLNPINEPADIIVANLPYIPTARIATLQPEIQGWEPREALDGGPDGLEHYRQLFKDATRVLRSGGHLFYELDGDTQTMRF